MRHHGKPRIRKRDFRHLADSVESRVVAESHDYGGRILAKRLCKHRHVATQVDERRLWEDNLHRAEKDAVAVRQLVLD